MRWFIRLKLQFLVHYYAHTLVFPPPSPLQRGTRLSFDLNAKSTHFALTILMSPELTLIREIQSTPPLEGVRGEVYSSSPQAINH